MINEPENENQVDNKIELLKYLAQVATRIKKDITSDFTLAKLDEQNKTGIIDMTANAYLLRRIIETLKEQSTTWKWNDKTKTWYKTNIDEKTKDTIDKIGKNIFDSYMIKVYMTAIMNRNVDNNNLVNILAGIQNELNNEKEEQVQEESKIKKTLKNLMGNLKNED